MGRICALSQVLYGPRMRHVTFTTFIAVLCLTFTTSCGEILKKKNQKEAMEGAKELGGEVERNEKALAEISNTLRLIGEAVENDKVPTDLMKTLGDIEMTFDASQIRGAPLAAMPSDVMEEVMKYTAGVYVVEAQRKRYQRLFGALSTPLTKHFEAKGQQLMQNSIIVRKEGDQFVAMIAHHRDPFPREGAWPVAYKVLVATGGRPTKWSESDSRAGR